MSLVRTILEQNTDPTFVDSLLQNIGIKNNRELVDLLKQGADTWFTEWLLNYIFDDYEDAVKEALKNSYHPTMIDALRKYTAKQGIIQRNLESRMFYEPDELRDFFAIHKVSLQAAEVEDIICNGFADDTIVVGSSYVVNDKDDLYFHFSAVKKLGMVESWWTKFEYVKKNFSWAYWKWLESVSEYLKKVFPEENLFSLLKLDPEKIL